MSSRPWMPFYIGDYIADTVHLTTLQHGAYLLLIMHYWRTGGLPNSDEQLALITRQSLKAWQKHIRPVLEPLFVLTDKGTAQECWRHKRLETELVKQAVISQKRTLAGLKGGNITAAGRFTTKHLKSMGSHQANAKQMGGSHSHNRDLKGNSESVDKPQGVCEKEQVPKSVNLEASPELIVIMQEKLCR